MRFAAQFPPFSLSSAPLFTFGCNKLIHSLQWECERIEGESTQMRKFRKSANFQASFPLAANLFTLCIAFCMVSQYLDALDTSEMPLLCLQINKIKPHFDLRARWNFVIYTNAFAFSQPFETWLFSFKHRKPNLKRVHIQIDCWTLKEQKSSHKNDGFVQNANKLS